MYHSTSKYVFSATLPTGWRAVETTTYLAIGDNRYLVRADLNLGPPIGLHPSEITALGNCESRAVRIWRAPRLTHAIGVRAGIATFEAATEVLKSWAKAVVVLRAAAHASEQGRAALVA
jgi:hypothetical protein